ncbi:MAG: ABC transporter substrate-binding protein [Actinomycetota bacterium]
MKKYLLPVALVLTLGIVAAACGGGESGGGDTDGGSDSVKGGVLRESLTDFGFTNAFDPTGEYLGSAWGYYSQMLIRGLVSYEFVGGAAGNVVVADLATDTGTVSDDGLTWTFTLKDGVQWGPPLDRPITSQDVAYAFQRINTKSLIAQYGNYYCGTIVGMDCSAESQDTPVSGISTPDDKTIVFQLEQPTGDFLYRLAQPAAFPVPAEVAGCFDQAGDYGRYVMANGPYMIQGQDALDATSCDTLQPISGFDPDAHLYLVRNPNYDPATDGIREANFDGFALTINTNLDDIYNKLQAGELDIVHGSPPAAVLQQYLTNPDLEGLLKSESADRTWYITMNLLVPPFDDIHVRKAVNFIVDKAAMLQAAGGATSGQIATTVEPPSVLADTADFDPYPSAEFAGDEAAAQAEMAQSKYDENGDGVCDADACNNVLMINRNYEPWTNYTPILQESLGKIGITLKVRELDSGTAYTTIQTASNLVPIAANAGWGKDYGSPFGFDYFLFNTAGLACEGSVNYSNIGMTEETAAECGDKVLAAWKAATNDGATPLPSVDADMDACVAIAPGPEYNACWAALDERIMTEIVPWVPYRWASAIILLSPTVGNYNFDQASGVISYAKVSVSNGLTMEEVTGGAA